MLVKSLGIKLFNRIKTTSYFFDDEYEEIPYITFGNKKIGVCAFAFVRADCISVNTTNSQITSMHICLEDDADANSELLEMGVDKLLEWVADYAKVSLA